MIILKTKSMLLRYIVPVTVALILYGVINVAHAQMIGFYCETTPEFKSDSTFKYNFEINKDSGFGTLFGYTVDGSPFFTDIRVHFSSIERMDMYSLKDNASGYINRKSLRFTWGGGSGQCKIVSIKSHLLLVPSESVKF